MASKITSLATPFSLATASTTINSSLLIGSWLPRPGLPAAQNSRSRRSGGLAPRAPGLLRGEPQRLQVRHDPRLFHGIERQHQFAAVHFDRNVLAVDA